MLELQLKRLKVDTYIGVYDWEQKKTQPLYITIKIDLNSDSASKSDLLEDTLDYESLQNRVKEHVESTRFALIEKVAADVHGIVMESPCVKTAVVDVEKPSALDHTESVRVRYTTP